VNLKDYKGARTNAENAVKYAKSPDQTKHLQDLLTFLEQVEHANASASVSSPEVAAPASQASNAAEAQPTLRRTADLSRLQVTTESFECVADGFRLHVLSGTKKMTFTMPDAKDVVVRNVDGGVLEWRCGPLKPLDVTVVYKPATSPGSEGIVAELVF
jgi:hypothetical protein